MVFHDKHKMAALIDNGTCMYWKTPAMKEYLQDLEPEYLGLIISSCVIILITSIIFFGEVIFIYRRRHTWPQPGKTLWLLGLYTIFGWTAFVGILVPRSGDLGAMVGTMYLATSLYVFNRLMVNYFGGRTKMLERLHGSEYTLRSPPCCCCLYCLPKVSVTPNSSNWTELCVLQFTVLQPVLVFLEAVIIADLQEDMNPQVTVGINTVGTVSSLVALYGLFLIFRASITHLAYASIKAKFVCLKLLVGIDALQKLILSTLAQKDIVPCASKLSHKDNALRISRFLMVLEAFLISILARMYYKRDQNLHLHPNHKSYVEDDDETQSLVRSGGSNDASDKSSTLVGSHDVRYGAVVDNGNETIPKTSPPTEEVVTAQPKAEA